MTGVPSHANQARNRPGWCVYTRFWPTGGTGLYAQNLVDALLDDGEAITFVCPETANPRVEGPRPGLTRLRPPRERKDETTPSRGILWSAMRMIATGFDLVRARWRCRNYIVSIPDPLIFTLPMLLLLRLTGARIALVVHDPVPHAWRFSERWRGIEMWSLNRLYHVANVLVVLSEPSRSKLLETFPSITGAVKVIEHGVFPMGNPVPAPGAGRFLVFGTIRRNKHILEAIAGAIEANRRGEHVRLLVAGDIDAIDPDYALECEEAAAAAPGLVEVRKRYIGDDELIEILAATDAFLMPYGDFFSQSGVAILAASNARAIIATRAGGIATLMDEGMAALPIESPSAASEIADTLVQFRRTPIEEWNRRAFDYRSVMLDRRSWTKIAQSFAALVHRLDDKTKRLR